MEKSKPCFISISIVSHGDDESIFNMLNTSSDYYFKPGYEIIIRENLLTESNYFISLSRKYKNIKVLYNKTRYGFGKNHNLNFKEISTHSKWFIVCNPDLSSLPKDLELGNYNKDIDQMVSPFIFEQDGSQSDFMRSQISIIKLVLRYFGFKGISLASSIEDENLWVPSVFQIFSVDLYKKLKGFDEEIFMYYEDYDICMRGKKYCKLIIDKNIKVFHEGRRSSRKNLNLLKSHIKSALYVLRKRRLKLYIK